MPLLPNRPETPIVETLKFLTDLLEKKSGLEQRICLRNAPRTEYRFDVMAEDGLERQLIENALVGGRGSEWYVPAWPEVAYLTEDAAPGATSLALDTSFSDFREGRRLLLVGPESGYELNEELGTVSGAAVALTNPLTGSWPAGTEVVPVRTAVLQEDVRSQRWGSNLTKYTFNFRVTENDVALSGSLPWDTLGIAPDAGLYVLDDPNCTDGSVPESVGQRLTIVDGNTGAMSVYTPWARSKRGSVRGWATQNREDLHNVRLLMHYLKGKQKAFILPTFASDLTPTTGLVSAASILGVANAGFFGYNALTGPRRYIRVVKNDGTFDQARVTNVTETSSVLETLTVTPAWSRSVAVDSIARAMILEKVRLDTDDIEITHKDLNGKAHLAVQTKAVFE